MDEEIEMIVLALGVDGVCEQFGINQEAVIKLMIEEGLIEERAIHGYIQSR